MTISQALKWAKNELMEACERPLFEAELLLAYHLEKERLYLHMYIDEEIADIERYKALVERRAKHEPYEYIVGKASFYDIELEVEPGVLIPRPETEILIEKVAQIIEQDGITLMAEIGIGSGAIAVVLARKFPQLHIIATDICDTPLKVAGKNIQKFGLQDQVELRKSNLIDEVPEALELVVSNPPYIAEDFILESNVVDYEPKEALFGGRVGDELLKQIITDISRRGIRYLACEMGYDQKAPIEAFVKDFEIEFIEFYQDLAGFDRGFVIKFKG
ncbi:peptide chain release factor N(5)-glutamine methyltransferase [Sulfurovum sp. zt1-1]|uniref:peptide chain release factor N(5)-glutamine methyltransferase n=1 Tax=Sulfurovum zhangzhouensis TaxID=3019067 RepID=A0ABT7QYW5_9BACT|nr:peptide chain release factor N(5)-glutamine methyltransferase [Sulfurovum zhangzhouensis]MDM5272029.1 peptide chain release factor N(5)-glutamine methyltransferase [Sulfurovum zhangzhouensis]